MTYRYYDEKILVILDGAGNQIGSCLTVDPAFQAWVAAGGVPLPDPQAAQKAKDALNAPIMAQIAALESSQHRAIRENALGQAGAVARLVALDAKLTTLRAQLR